MNHTLSSRLKVFALASVLALPLSLSAEEQVKEAEVLAASLQGTSTVVSIDAEKREVTLKRDDGSLVVVAAGDEVRNFDQVHVGDIVEVSVAHALAYRVEPATTKVRERKDSYSGYRAKLGQKPEWKSTHTIEVTATVEAVDPQARTVTIKGAKRSVTLEVDESTDLATIKVGDNVYAAYIETASIKVSTPAK